MHEHRFRALILHRRGHALTATLAGWVLGTAWQLQQSALWPAGHYLAVALVAGVLFGLMRWLRRPRRAMPGIALLCLLAAALTAFAVTGWRAQQRLAQQLDPALEGRDVVLVGTIARMPQRGPMGWRFRFDVDEARLDGAVVRLPPQVQLAWYGAVSTADETDAAAPLAADLRAGDRWRLTARLKRPHGNQNPHGFDYELWLWEQGIRATGYVRTSPRDAPPRRLAVGGWSVERWRQSVRDRILDGAGQGDADARRFAGIVAALVTGDQNVIERADWDVFRATGVAHLMSISGLHITMFSWLAVALVGALWRRLGRWAGAARWNPCLWLPAPTAALIGGVALAAGYALFSGWGVPAQRTVLMLATFALLKLSGLRWPWWLTWLLACAVVLAADPWALLQAGFWLSFVAVAILFATDSRADGAAGTGAKAGFFIKLLREQWVVTLALTPLSLILFGQASVVGLLANLLAIPAVTVVITPLALAGMLWAPLWTAAGWALLPLAWVLRALSTWPWASVSMATAPLALGVAAVAGGVLLALRWPWPWRLAGVPLLLPLLLWQPARPPAGQFELLAADVGQGSAVVVRTAGHTLLYDAGPRYSRESDAGHRVLVPLLRAFGERVNMLVLSHRDTDHVGGARAVLAAQPGASLLSSIEDEHELQDTRTAMRCQAGQQWTWDGVEFSVLHPDAADYAMTAKANALSCVLRVRAGERAALLVGDIETAQELRLVARHEDLRADVLLVPHHGSRTSSSGRFIGAVQPRWALVQSGYRNRFGHPVPTVTARYAERGAQIVDSPACGAMRWHSGHPGVVRCHRDEARRYWHHAPTPRIGGR
ncbi:MAG: DNA internalization-related competence protein ComEC/Rec2 [Pseudomonadota bacterium]|nr:DNA internalization-related competence protein ComEC/Rec2 [Pseudomonadota bacterium]